MFIQKIRYLLVVIAVIIGSLITLYINKRNPRHSSQQIIRIATLTPAVHPAMDDILEGFETTFGAGLPDDMAFEQTDYNANGNKTLLRAQAEEIVNGNFDLIFTIGNAATHTVAELAKKRGSQIPHVFTAIDDPVGKGLIESMEQPGGNVTGIVSVSPFEEQIRRLIEVKPTVKNIYLVYDPAHPSNHKDKETLSKICAQYNIAFDGVEIMNTGELVQKVSAFVDRADTFLVLYDHAIVVGIDALVNLCNKYGITLYASDLNCADKGAALAFGVLEREYGVYAAKIARRIIQKEATPATIPVVSIEKQYLKINTATMKIQGINLSPEQLKEHADHGDIII